jgi:hypothetical protein
VNKSALDRFFPRLGVCWFCGTADQRHRVLDAIVEHSAAGESVEDIAGELNLSVEAVRVALAEWTMEG